MRLSRQPTARMNHKFCLKQFSVEIHFGRPHTAILTNKKYTEEKNIVDLPIGEKETESLTHISLLIACAKAAAATGRFQRRQKRHENSIAEKKKKTKKRKQEKYVMIRKLNSLVLTNNDENQSSVCCTRISQRLTQFYGSASVKFLCISS